MTDYDRGSFAPRPGRRGFERDGVLSSLAAPVRVARVRCNYEHVRVDTRVVFAPSRVVVPLSRTTTTLLHFIRGVFSRDGASRRRRTNVLSRSTSTHFHERG